MDTIFGLPAHPLLVHGVTVLLPLAALGAIVAAVSPTWRERIGWVAVGIAGLGVVFTYLAKESGEALEEYIEHTEGVSPLLHAHTELGDVALFWALPLFLAILGFMAYHEYRRRGGQPPLAMASGLSLGLIALVIVASAATTLKIVQVGHSGAKATWEDVQLTAGSDAWEGEEHEGEGHGGDGDRDEDFEGMGVAGVIHAPIAR